MPPKQQPKAKKPSVKKPSVKKPSVKKPSVKPSKKPLVKKPSVKPSKKDKQLNDILAQQRKQQRKHTKNVLKVLAVTYGVGALAYLSTLPEAKAALWRFKNNRKTDIVDVRDLNNPPIDTLAMILKDVPPSHYCMGSSTVMSQTLYILIKEHTENHKDSIGTIKTWMTNRVIKDFYKQYAYQIENLVIIVNINNERIKSLHQDIADIDNRVANGRVMTEKLRLLREEKLLKLQRLKETLSASQQELSNLQNSTSTFDTIYRFSIPIDKNDKVSFDRVIDKDDNFKYSEVIISEIKKYEILYVHCSLKKEGDDFGHATAVIFDRATKTVEYYDPNGLTYGINVQKSIEKLFTLEFAEPLGYKYIDLTQHISCPVFPQVHGADNRKHCKNGGLCVVYSGMFVYLRVLYPKIKSERLIQDFYSLKPSVLLDLTLRFHTIILQKCALDPYCASILNEFDERNK
jgi:hypothetical protein